MHLNDQGTTTPDGIPVAPIEPTNNVPPVVPGNIVPNTDSDQSDAPIEAPLDTESKAPDAQEETPESGQTGVEAVIRRYE